MKLPLGKLPRKVLTSKVLEKITTDKSVLLPPKYGEDGSVVKTDSNLIISAADPITGATKYAGWLSVHVNANDIAVHAAKPKWFTTILMFPKNTDENKIEETMQGILEALREINANLIGGHTEVTDRVSEAIIAGFMMGIPMISGKFISSSGAKPGDLILMTKGAGIEGTLLLASELCTPHKCNEELIKRALRYKEYISILPEVRVLVSNLDINGIHAMHDATEGGLLNAIYEVAMASGLGFKIDRKKVIVRKETKELAEIFNVDPLRLISSGTLIVALDRKHAYDAVRILRENSIDSEIIGEFTDNQKMYIYEGSKLREEVAGDIIDEYWLLLEKQSN